MNSGKSRLLQRVRRELADYRKRSVYRLAWAAGNIEAYQCRAVFGKGAARDAEELQSIHDEVRRLVTRLQETFARLDGKVSPKVSLAEESK